MMERCFTVLSAPVMNTGSGALTRTPSLHVIYFGARPSFHAFTSCHRRLVSMESYSELSGRKQEPAVKELDNSMPVVDSPSTLMDASPFEESNLEAKVASGSEVDGSSELYSISDMKFNTEDAVAVFIYGAGAFVTVWVAYAIVRAVDSLPLVPKFMEVVGLSYTFWFLYRYLLFKKNRIELAEIIDAFKEEVLDSD